MKSLTSSNIAELVSFFRGALPASGESSQVGTTTNSVNGSQSLKSKLSRHLKTCGAVLALASGTVTDGSSQLVSWTNANLVIPATIDGMYINVETKQTGTTGASVAGWDINPYSATSLTWFNATGTGMMRYPGVTSGSAGSLTSGTAIGVTGSYGSGAVVVGSSPGNWQLNASNYFGFKFVAADGLTHYGWGKFVIGAAINGADRYISEIHYESTAGKPITIGCDGQLAANPSVTDPSCSGASDGSVSLSPSGGTSPYTYSWDNGSTGSSITGLTAGVYSFTVTDANSCTAASSSTVTNPVGGGSLTAIVTNTLDSGAGSLRQALSDVCSNGTITFDNSLNGQTITLTSGQLDIFKGVTIDASALTNGLAVSAGGASRVFEVSASGAKVKMKGFTVTGGNVTGSGGAILVNEVQSVTLEKMRVQNSSATSGGGVYKTFLTLPGRQVKSGSRDVQTDSLILLQTTIDGNMALYGGGCILRADTC